MLKAIAIIDCYQRRFRDQYQYKENAYISNDTILIRLSVEP